MSETQRVTVKNTFRGSDAETLLAAEPVRSETPVKSRFLTKISRRHGTFLAGCFLLSVTLSNACMGPRPPFFESLATTPVVPISELVVGYSNQGRPIRATVLGQGTASYLMLGTIHGNEPLGKSLLARFKTHLLARPHLLAGKRVILIPVANPDGFARSSRFNAQGVDLNRNFPSTCWRPRSTHGPHPASELETRTLLQVVKTFQPRRILSIHSPLRCINFDGPANELARRIAEATGYPLRPSIGYPTPGAFENYVGRDLKIPSITFETGHEASDAQAWQESKPGLLAFLESGATELGAAGDRNRDTQPPRAAAK